MPFRTARTCVKSATYLPQASITRRQPYKARRALVGIPCPYPAILRRVDGAIIWAIQTKAKMANHTSHRASSADGAARGRIQRLLVASPNLRTHWKPHSSALAVPRGMPASRAAAASTTMPRSTSGRSGKSAYCESCAMSRCATSRAARRLASEALSGSGDEARARAWGALRLRRQCRLCWPPPAFYAEIVAWRARL